MAELRNCAALEAIHVVVAESCSGETTESAARGVDVWGGQARARADALVLWRASLAGLGDANVPSRRGSLLNSLKRARSARCTSQHCIWRRCKSAGTICPATLTQATPRLPRGADWLRPLGMGRLGLLRAHGGVFWLGSAARYGLACELSLKMKEMSLSDSEPFHFLEFRHGPQSMARAGALIVGLRGDANAVHEQALFDEMSGYGASVIALGAENADVVLDVLPKVVRGPLYLPFC